MLQGTSTDGYSGLAVNGAGDVNGDGFDDLIIGDSYANPTGGEDQGESYIVYGRSGGFAAALALSNLDGTSGFRLAGIAPYDFSGVSVSGAGDINGDGFDDLIIGAYLAGQPGSGFPGESYVIFGGNFTGGAETQVGGDGSQTLNATLGAGVDILIGGRGDDTLVSDGGDDVLRGGEGDDILAIPDTNFSPRRLQGGTGFDTLRLDGAGLTLDLTLIADNRITGIEQIDVTGSGNNTLTLNALEVLNLSGSSNTLIVRRNVGDVVNRAGGWVQQANEVIGGDLFEVFTQGAATLKVQSLAPPLLISTSINGGSSNRSGIGPLAWTFDVSVTIPDVNSLQLFNHTSSLLLILPANVLSGNGTDTLVWDLTGILLPDARYTATLPADQVTTTAGSQLELTRTIEFHVLRGDVSGDARTNASDFVAVDANFDPLLGTPYRAGDANGDGLVNASDFVEVDANFNPLLLAPLTYDFGDVPETGTSFPTTLAQDGARHILDGSTLRLGADRDAEADGQPDATASGDGADEDGISVDLVQGAVVGVTVVTNGAGIMNAWIDYNQDGDWDDASEQIFIDQPVAGGTNNVVIQVPAGAALGSTFARFRFTSTAGYSYFGLAPDGEVEDYQLTVAAPPAGTSNFERPTSNVERKDVDELNFDVGRSTLDVRRSGILWWVMTRDASHHHSLITAGPYSLFGQSLSLFSEGRQSRLRGR